MIQDLQLNLSEPIMDESSNSVTVQVVYFGLIRNVVNVAEETVALPRDATVRSLFDRLCEKYGDSFADALFTAEGTLGANAIILLDGRNILGLGGLDAPIPERTSAHILLTTTAMGGG